MLPFYSFVQELLLNENREKWQIFVMGVNFTTLSWNIPHVAETVCVSAMCKIFEIGEIFRNFKILKEYHLIQMVEIRTTDKIKGCKPLH